MDYLNRLLLMDLEWSELIRVKKKRLKDTGISLCQRWIIRGQIIMLEKEKRDIQKELLEYCPEDLLLKLYEH